MIQRLYVNNYKCLVNFELHLQELSLLLGQSGVGKTSVLDIVFSLRRLLSGDARITDTSFQSRSLTIWQSLNVQVIEIEVRLEEDTFTYRLEVEHDRTSKRARIRLEYLLADGGPLFRFALGDVHLFRDDHSEGPIYSADWSESALARVASRSDNTRLSRFLDFMRNVLVCGLYPPVFNTVSEVESPLLARNAENFVDWYRHVLQERPDLSSDFTEALKRAIGGGFHGIRLARVGNEARSLVVEFDYKSGGELLKTHGLKFEEISDGQRALVALYGLVHLARDQAYTLFIDEPDNYVALPEIQPWLMALEDVCGDSVSQAVITSHNPELIDYLGPENGVLLKRETSGNIITRRPEVRAEDTPGLKLSELMARGWE